MPTYNFVSYSEEKVEKGKTGYFKMTVNYSTKGESKSKNIMSFANPAVYNAVKTLNEGDLFEVEFVKDDKYFNWASLKPIGQAVPPPVDANVKAGTGAPTARQSTYETADERAKKQVYIIKQSCLAQAVAWNDAPRDIPEILEVAQKFVDWVLDDGKDLFKEPNDL